MIAEIRKDEEKELMQFLGMEEMEEKEEMVTITKAEHDQLVEDQMFLEALKGCGVDNWCGYDQACEMVYED